MTTANNFQIIDQEFDNPLAGIITDYQLGEQLEKDKWGDAVSLTKDDSTGDTMNGDQWRDYYLSAETEQVAGRLKTGEPVPHTKAGKIVASKAFPKTWNTDKAIIGKALDNEIELFKDDGTPKAKSALQEEYKAAADELKEEKSAYEKIVTTINTFTSLYHELNEDETTAVKILMNEVLNPSS